VLINIVGIPCLLSGAAVATNAARHIWRRIARAAYCETLVVDTFPPPCSAFNMAGRSVGRSPVCKRQYAAGHRARPTVLRGSPALGIQSALCSVPAAARFSVDELSMTTTYHASSLERDGDGGHPGSLHVRRSVAETL